MEPKAGPVGQFDNAVALWEKYPHNQADLTHEEAMIILEKFCKFVVIDDTWPLLLQSNSLNHSPQLNTALFITCAQHQVPPYLPQQTSVIGNRMKLEGDKYIIPVIKKAVNLKEVVRGVDSDGKSIIGWESNKDVKFISQCCHNREIELVAGKSSIGLDMFQNICYLSKGYPCSWKIVGELPVGLKLYRYVCVWPGMLYTTFKKHGKY